MKQDVINCCADQGVATLRNVNEALHGFVKEIGGWSKLPTKFTLNVSAMTQFERDIETAIAEGDLRKTEDLCDQYKDRFVGYLDGWRRIIAKGAQR